MKFILLCFVTVGFMSSAHAYSISGRCTADRKKPIDLLLQDPDLTYGVIAEGYSVTRDIGIRVRRSVGDQSIAVGVLKNGLSSPGLYDYLSYTTFDYNQNGEANVFFLLQLGPDIRDEVECRFQVKK